MVNRLIKIAVLTGAAHVFTIITLKFLSERVTAEKISLLGEVDSLFQLIVIIIAMGLQLSAVREIATSPDWKTTYYETQTARLTMSIVLIPLSLLSVFNHQYKYFLLAPVFALSGDYALYARAKPVFASVISFFRVALPSLLLIIITFLRNDWSLPIYIISTILIYLITNKIITNSLQVPLWYTPSTKSLKLYLKSFYLGLTSLFWYILGLGLIILVPYFYNTQITAVAYIGLKIYMVFKGLLRIINQAFVKEMIDERLALKVDQLCILAGLSFLGLTLFFPGTISSFLLGSYPNENLHFFMYLSLAGLMCSLFISNATRAILFHMDSIYAKYNFIAVLIALLFVILLSYIRIHVDNIGIGLLAGESCFAAGLFVIGKGKLAKQRIIFLLRASLLLLTLLPARLYWGDGVTAMIVGFSTFSIIGLFTYYKMFSLTP